MRATKAGLAGMCLALALALSPCAAATAAEKAVSVAAPVAPLESVLLMRLDAEVAVDETGRVTDVIVLTPAKDDLRAGVERVVRAWTFNPVIVGGVAAPMRAKAKINVGAVPGQVVNHVWIDAVTFDLAEGAAVEQPTATLVVDKQGRPVYPEGVLYAGVKGLVLVGVRVGEDGRVQDAVVVRSSLLDVNGRDEVLRQALAQFEASALRAARRFRFDVTVRNGAVPTADDLTVIVPYRYILGAASIPKAGEWRLHVRAPKQEIPWLSTAAKVRASGLADAGDGATPVAGGLHLISPLGGDIAVQ